MEIYTDIIYIFDEGIWEKHMKTFLSYKVYNLKYYLQRRNLRETYEDIPIV